MLYSSIPPYDGSPSITLNNDVPDDIISDAQGMSEGEIWLSALDHRGRAGAAMMVARSASLPTGERGPTGQYKPSGWHQNKYPGVVNSEPPYLMNRSHLLMWALSGLTDTKENLISGTRYMNADGMLPIEEEVLNHVKTTGDSVVYRVTPVYEGNNLFASGVIIEAESMTGDFRLCRYVYNVQPGVDIDYATGENHLSVTTEDKPEPMPESTPEPLDEYAFILNTHTLKFHRPDCDSVTEMKAANREGFNGTAEELIAKGCIGTTQTDKPACPSACTFGERTNLCIL